MKKLNKNKLISLPLLVFFLALILFYWKYWFKGLLPIPADIITGVYYPWLDYQWGTTTGVPVKNPLISDIPSLMYPWKNLAISLMKQGIWPLWNQYSFAGTPLLGNWQSAPFSITNIWHTFLPPIDAWTLGIISQSFISLFSFYYWITNKKITKPAAILGSIIYTFNGFQLMWLYYNTHNWLLAFFPLLLLSIDKIIEKKYYWTWILSIIVAVSILAGYPILLIYEGIIIFIYLVTQLISISKKQVLYTILLFSFSVVLGLAMTLFYVLPGITTIEQSIHQLDKSTLNSASGGMLQYKNFITLLAPDFFGNPATYNYFGEGYYDNFAMYASITGLILAIISIARITTIYPWLLCFVIGVLLSTDNTLGNQAREITPFLNNSIPSRAIFLIDTSLAILAAFGLDYLHTQKKYKQIKFIFLKLHTNNAKLQYLIISIISFISILSLWFVSQDPIYFSFSNEQLAVSNRNILLPLLVSASLTGIGLLLLHKKFTKFVTFCLIVLTAAELFRFGWKYLPYTPSEYLFPNTHITDWLQEQQKQSPEPFRVEFGEVIPPNMWIPYRLESPTGYDALLPLRYGQFIEAIQSNKYSKSISRFPEIQQLDSPLFPLTNTKYITVINYNQTAERKSDGTIIKDIYQKDYLEPVFRYKTVSILENKRFIPRATFVPKHQLISNSTEIINTLTSTTFNPSETIIIEKEPKYTSTNKNIKLTKPHTTIKWLNYLANSKIIQVNNSQPGWLLLLDNYDSGWKANINGKSEPLYRANFTFMALQLNKTETQTITLEYWPAEFIRGLIISISSMFLWIATLLIYTLFNKINKQTA